MNCESINGPDMGRTFIFYIGPVRPKVVVFGLGSGLEIFGPYGPLLTTILFLNYMTKIVIFILFFCMKQNCCSIKYQVFSCISHLDFEPEPKKKIHFSDETKSRTEPFLFLRFWNWNEISFLMRNWTPRHFYFEILTF